MTTLSLAEPLAAPPAGADLVAAAAALGAIFARGAAQRDAERLLPVAELRQVAASGLLAARNPAGHGGPEVSFVALARIAIALAQGDPNIAQAILPHYCVVEWLRLDATERQQAQWYGAIRDGALIANAFAERGGKLIGDIRTALVRDGAGYRLRGEKFYSTGSLFADYLQVIAIDETGGRVLAIFPRFRDGVTVRDDWDGMGQRTTASGTTLLDDVRVAAEEVIFLPRWGQRRHHIGATAQLLHSAIDAGIALAALDEAAELGRSRGRPLPEAGVERASEDPYVLHAVGEMAVAAHGAEALVERAAGFLDEATAALFAGAPADRLLGRASIAVAEAKAATEEASLRVSQSLYRVAGASATARELNLDRHWRNARTHTTHDPVAYKYKAVGDFHLNDRLPPITTKI